MLKTADLNLQGFSPRKKISPICKSRRKWILSRLKFLRMEMKAIPVLICLLIWELLNRFYLQKRRLFLAEAVLAHLQEARLLMLERRRKKKPQKKRQLKRRLIKRKKRKKRRQIWGVACRSREWQEEKGKRRARSAL